MNRGRNRHCCETQPPQSSFLTSRRVQFVTVDVPNGEHRSPAFLAKNPSGAVPVLELEDGTCIAECTAITEYIDHADGNPTLTGKTAKDRAVIHMMQRRAEAGLLDAVGTYFHHATPGLGPTLETYQCAEWGGYQKERATSQAMDSAMRDFTPSRSGRTCCSARPASVALEPIIAMWAPSFLAIPLLIYGIFLGPPQ